MCQIANHHITTSAVFKTLFLFSGLHLTLGLKVSDHSFYILQCCGFLFLSLKNAILDNFIKLNKYV